MAQHDYDIENSSFPAFRTNLNGVLSAINSSNSGSSRPSSAVAGTIWLDTSGAATAQLLKMYDGAGDITLGTVNFTANTVDWSDSSIETVTFKQEGTNFTGSLLVGHATSGTLNAAENNTGVGIDALDALTTGDSNTAVGFQAASTLTSGTNNTFLGKEAGKIVSNSSNNTAIGGNSLFYNTTSSNNTALGKNSVFGLTGADNTAVGYQSLKGVANQNGNSNTALGSGSGLAMTTGANNIFIGKSSGDNITTGDGNVIIGSINADSATGDKQLILADGVDGSVAWIKGDSNGQVKLISGYVLEVALTDASTITWNAATQPVAKVTLGASRTMGLPANPVSGQFISLLIIQDGTGSRTITWNAAYEFAADTAPTLTATANLGDLFTFRYNGAKWLEVGRNLALTLS